MASNEEIFSFIHSLCYVFGDLPFKMTRHSILQKQVLSLYRSFLREIKSKPAENQQRFQTFISRGFRKDCYESGLTTRDIDAIEYLIRKGSKQLEYLKNPSITNIAEN